MNLSSHAQCIVGLTQVRSRTRDDPSAFSCLLGSSSHLGCNRDKILIKDFIPINIFIQLGTWQITVQSQQNNVRAALL